MASTSGEPYGAGSSLSTRCTSKRASVCGRPDPGEMPCSSRKDGVILSGANFQHAQPSVGSAPNVPDNHTRSSMAQGSCGRRRCLSMFHRAFSRIGVVRQPSRSGGLQNAQRRLRGPQKSRNGCDTPEELCAYVAIQPAADTDLLPFRNELRPAQRNV